MGLLDLLAPRRFVRRVTDIDTGPLWDDGYRALIIDLDNTLVPWMTQDLADDVRSWLDGAKERGLVICVLSNTRKHKRLDWVERTMGCAAEGAGFWGMKPFRAPFRRALARIGAEPSQTVMIGDQIFTDILGGNRAGLYTIRVEPLSGREFFGTRFSRLLERLLFRLIDRGPETRD
jgi:HAD superfamily phosphatase (TIGR01668 family)